MARNLAFAERNFAIGRPATIRTPVAAMTPQRVLPWHENNIQLANCINCGSPAPSGNGEYESSDHRDAAAARK
jgi:Zn ribbon nucleic-acid-binding protein